MNASPLERVKKLESEVRDLRKQNEIAYGQVIEVSSLRQQVGRLQAENERLLSQVTTGNINPAQTSDITNIEAEIQSLGVELNTTLIRLMQEAPPDATQKAIESLREAISESRVQNPAGFLNKAIRDAWKPNEKHAQRVEHNLFSEWFDWAKASGIVQAATQIDGIQHVLTVDNEWIPFNRIFHQYENKMQEMTLQEKYSVRIPLSES